MKKELLVFTEQGVEHVEHLRGGFLFLVRDAAGAQDRFQPDRGKGAVWACMLGLEGTAEFSLPLGTALSPCAFPAVDEHTVRR